ncbi:hypothetical protein SRABI128_05779 [Microbacterium sp. Bi128]|nr:hypothetical protein SRABI128_05779 [Microbacterium sp. Bi128]
MIGRYAFPGREQPGKVGLAFLGGADDLQHQLGLLLDHPDQLAGLFLGAAHPLGQIKGQAHEVGEE